MQKVDTINAESWECHLANYKAKHIFAIVRKNTAITSKKDNEHNIVRGLQYIQNSEMN